MSIGIHFSGPARYRLQSAAALGQAMVEASTRRMLKGPRRPDWNWYIELSTHMLRAQLTAAFNKKDVKEARAYLDSVVISSPVLSQVDTARVATETFPGTWIVSKGTEPRVTALYLHGGGYSFYPHAYASFIALITLVAETRTFALDYRLAPEHCFPTQLEDALNAYRWLLGRGNPEDLVVIGDSAGAHLALGLLLAVRDSQLPFPALTVALSPPTDFETDFPSITANQEFDWIEKRMLVQWADWFCAAAQRKNRLISPLQADLRGLSPIYIQAGGSEILYDGIQAFGDSARRQGVDVVLETWEDMNHVFQMFGTEAPQSSAALRRIAEVINFRVRKSKV